MGWVNADLIFTHPIDHVVDEIFRHHEDPFCVSRRHDVERIEDAGEGAGTLLPPSGADFFLWRHGFFPRRGVALQPYVIGRFAWDSWLMHVALGRGRPPIDPTEVLHICHPRHSYSHFAGVEQTAACVEETHGCYWNRSLCPEAHGAGMDNPRWIRLKRPGSRSRLCLLTSFAGPLGETECAALRSWRRFAGAPVLVLGEPDDEVRAALGGAVAFIRREFYRTELNLGSGGSMPLLSSMLELGDRLSKDGDLVAWVPSDAVLARPLAPALERVLAEHERPFVVAGRSGTAGRPRAAFFAWPHGFFRGVAAPPIVVGRGPADDWLESEGLARGRPPIDLSHVLDNANGIACASLGASDPQRAPT